MVIESVIKDKKLYSVSLFNKNKGLVERIWEMDITLPKKPTNRNIFNNHKVKRNQRWQRILPPETFYMDKPESEYTDEEIKFIEEDFERRENGIWFMNNGKPTYITGLHYWFLNWIKMDIGYPDYRDRDRRSFIYWQACVVDPKSYGEIEVKSRRSGATYRGGAIVLEYITSNFNAIGGVLSKTGADAKEFFNKIVKMFRGLPGFYRPIMSGTDNPKTVLEFDKPGERITKKKQTIQRSEALESRIEWKNTAENSFDSYKLARFVCDEGGKWMEADVYKNWQVVKPALSNKTLGKAFFPSTVNEMTRKGGENFKKIWDGSNPNERSGNDRTISGLYRYFVPAYDGLEYGNETFIDEYGYSVIETPEKPVKSVTGEWIKIGAKEFLNNIKKSLEGDSNALAEHKRQFPWNPEEAFMVEVKQCAFNVENLYSQFDWNTENADKLITPGDFIWVDGFGGDVEFRPSKTGRWLVTWVPEVKEQNKKIYRNGLMYPGNMDTMCSALDPYDHDTTVDGTRSNAASYVFRMASPVYPLESNMFVSEYIARPPTAYIMYEDMLKQSIFYGTQILVEDNKPGTINWFTEKGFRHYLMNRPEITQTKNNRRPGAPGVPTTGEAVRDTLIGVSEMYIYHYVGWSIERNEVGLVYFNRLIKDWLTFEVDKWTKYDATVAAGLTLIASKKHVKKPMNQDNKSQLVRQYKVHGNKSILIKR